MPVVISTFPSSFSNKEVLGAKNGLKFVYPTASFCVCRTSLLKSQLLAEQIKYLHSTKIQEDILKLNETNKVCDVCSCFDLLEFSYHHVVSWVSHAGLSCYHILGHISGNKFQV